MARLSISLGMWALIGWMGSGAESVTAAGNQETLLGTAVPQRLRALCGACHCDGADEGGIAFDGLLERACAAGADSPGRQGGADHDAWLAIWKNLRAGVMPPADELQPSATERALVLGLIEREIFGLDPARPDPGRVVLRRLNRVEYANTIRDLVGLDINVVDNLPTDDTGFGFDTIADVLTLSPLVVEKYLETATAVAKQIVSKVQAPQRGGLLTHGSFLTVTSNPSRTSPVKRGLFILDNLLGTPARPAPADVPSLETAAAQVLKNATMRDLMTQHRHDALCASCHARMDPLGLALEPYNAVGQWREAADRASLETGGRLITGESFANVRELSACIADQRRPDFYRCLSEKILTYALGRGVEYYDATVVDKIVADLLEADGLRTLVQSVVASDAFQLRRQGFANSSKTDQKELAP